MPVGESVLFFGCRDPLQDFLYEGELRGFKAAGVTRLFPVFSREPGKPKTCVQQTIQANSDVVWRLLQQGAIVFVCGEAARIAPDVRQSVHGVHGSGRGRASLADPDGGEPSLSRGYMGVWRDGRLNRRLR